MIFIKIKGGLGNQLFQYALGVYIKQTFNIAVKYDASYFDIKHRLDTPRQLSLNLIVKDFESKKASTKEIGGFKAPAIFNQTFLGEYLSVFSLILNKRFNKGYYLQPGNKLDFNLLTKYNYLDGYWQSGQHVLAIINHIIDDIDQEFVTRLIDPFKAIGNITPLDVCVHIRRGDYVSKPSASLTHGVCSIEYYNKGMDHFKEQLVTPRFFFFSDDIAWAKNTFGNAGDFVFIDYDVPDKDLAEFFLMTRFSNFIIANSTYSWWTAVISKSQNVIAPEQWFVNGVNELALDGWKVI